MSTSFRSALACALCLFAPLAFGQSTDGYHAIQVFPVVVDTASFTQRFTFRNPYSDDVGSRVVAVGITYYPAMGTAQATPMACNTLNLTGGASHTFASLREICPALPLGSNFGMLVARSVPGPAVATSDLAFAGFSRVSNPLGAGFNVEAFAASNFTSATSVVDGVRRLAATPGSPTFQTNCFVGNIGEITPSGTPVPTSVEVRVFDAANVQVGTTRTVALLPGQVERLLDVFQEVGAPAQDFPDARVSFTKVGSESPGLLSFCTVQDNTSFNADFRIGKQELFSNFMVGSQDQQRYRDIVASGDLKLPGTAALRTFGIPNAITAPSGDSSNDHLFQFQHPDVVSCEVRNPATNARALASYGLEMRLLAFRGGVWVPIAGGNDATGFDELFLGDKIENGAGANAFYLLEVEGNGQISSADRPYKLRCRSGSGHGIGHLVRTGGPVLF